MKFRLFPFTWILVLFFPALSKTQTVQHWGLALHAGVSHSGWNLAVVTQYRFNNFQAYIGPSISLNRGLPGKGPIGFNTGCDYILNSNLSWLSTVINADYQANFFSSSGHTDLTHEIHVSYGLRILATDRLFFVQQMGYGFFLESFFEESSNKRKTVSGYTGLVRLRAGYLF